MNIIDIVDIIFQPALSVPIHVVELTNVPPELRSGNIGPVKEDTKQDKKKEQVRITNFNFICC